MPSGAEETMETLRAHNEFLVAAVARLKTELHKTKAELRDARECKIQLERQVDALEKVLRGA